MQAQNEEVKWNVEIDKDINKDINKEGLSIIYSMIEKPST